MNPEWRPLSARRVPDSARELLQRVRGSYGSPASAGRRPRPVVTVALVGRAVVGGQLRLLVEFSGGVEGPSQVSWGRLSPHGEEAAVRPGPGGRQYVCQPADVGCRIRVVYAPVAANGVSGATKVAESDVVQAAERGTPRSNGSPAYQWTNGHRSPLLAKPGPEIASPRDWRLRATGQPGPPGAQRPYSASDGDSASFLRAYLASHTAHPVPRSSPPLSGAPWSTPRGEEPPAPGWAPSQSSAPRSPAERDRAASLQPALSVVVSPPSPYPDPAPPLSARLSMADSSAMPRLVSFNPEATFAREVTGTSTDSQLPSPSMRGPPPGATDLPAMAGVRVAVLGPGAGCRVGNVVKGVFQYSGPEEGVHEHKWIRVDSYGIETLVEHLGPHNRQPQSQYRLTEKDVGCLLQYAVRPYSRLHQVGDWAFSAALGPVLPGSGEEPESGSLGQPGQPSLLARRRSSAFSAYVFPATQRTDSSEGDARRPSFTQQPRRSSAMLSRLSRRQSRGSIAGGNLLRVASNRSIPTMRSMLDGSDAGKPVIELLHEDGLRPGFYVNAETELNEDVVEFKWVRIEPNGRQKQVGSAVTYRIVEEDVGCRLQVHTRQISPRVTEWVPSDPTDEVEEAKFAMVTLEISGTPQEGETLSCITEIVGGEEDPEASTVQWYRVWEVDGELRPEITDVEGQTYKCTSSDIGALIHVDYTPASTAGETGETCAARTERVEAAFPEAQQVTVRGDPAVGQALRVEFQYLGGQAGKPVIKWYCTDEGGGDVKEIVAARDEVGYTTTPFDVDRCVFAEVTPVRMDGMHGTPVISSPVGPIAGGEPEEEGTSEGRGTGSREPSSQTTLMLPADQLLRGLPKNSKALRLTSSRLFCFARVAAEVPDHKPGQELVYSWQTKSESDRGWKASGSQPSYIPTIDDCNCKLRCILTIHPHVYCSEPLTVTLDKKTATDILKYTSSGKATFEVTFAGNEKACTVLLTHQGVTLSGPAFGTLAKEFPWASSLHVVRSTLAHDAEVGVELVAEGRESLRLRARKETERDMFIATFRAFQGLSLKKLCIQVLGEAIYSRWSRIKSPTSMTPSTEPVDAASVGYQQAKELLVAMKPTFGALTTQTPTSILG